VPQVEPLLEVLILTGLPCIAPSVFVALDVEEQVAEGEVGREHPRALADMAEVLEQTACL
jgi:hypothetical protein